MPHRIATYLFKTNDEEQEFVSRTAVERHLKGRLNEDTLQSGYREDCRDAVRIELRLLCWAFGHRPDDGGRCSVCGAEVRDA